ncbi:MAG: hypothetical protein KJ645_12705, partial [Planctomycetes bacterium]|nr:hypothetical protein [Planctomycetota bacterium]
RSRCQCYDFRRITAPDIKDRLEKIAQAESIECEPGVLMRIAALSRGGLRDAESLLDQIAALGGGTASFSALNSLTGRLSPEEMGSLIDAILEEDTEQILAFVNKVFASGTQGADLLKDLIDYLRVLMSICAGAKEPLTAFHPDLEERVLKQAEKTDLDTVLICLQIALETLKNVRWFDDESVLTEIALIKMARLSHTVALSDALESSVMDQEKESNNTPPARGVENSATLPNQRSGQRPNDRSPREKEEKKTTGPESKSSRSSIEPVPIVPSEAYMKVVRAVAGKSRSLAAYLERLDCRALEEGRFVLENPSGGKEGLFKLEDVEIARLLEESARQVLGGEYRFIIKENLQSGQKELPPMVRKTLDRFEGDLL